MGPVPAFTPSTARGDRVLVPLLIALELSAGLIQGWLGPLLGDIATHYGVGGGDVAWILTVGLLCSAVCVPLMGVLADRYGPRRLLLIAVWMTAAGSLLIAAAPSFEWVLVGAAVQSPIAALMPLEMALLKLRRPEEAARFTGVLVGCLAGGLAVGSLLSGQVMDGVGSVPGTQLVGALPLVVLSVAVLVVPRTAGRPEQTVDWAGAITFGLAVLGVMYGLSEGPTSGWTAPVTLLAFGAGGAAAVTFWRVESRTAEPLFDVRMLAAGHLNTPLLLGMLVAFTVFGSLTATALYAAADPLSVGYGLGAGAGDVGLVMAVVALAQSAGAFAGVVLARRFPTRTVLAGSCVLGGLATVLLVPGPTSMLAATGIFAAVALGTGGASAILPGVVVNLVPERSSGAVSGLYSTGRTVAGSLAGALIAALLASVVTSGDDPSLNAFRALWLIFAVALFAAAVLGLSLRLPSPDQSRPGSAQTSPTS